jgi:hypothetical protein
MPAGHVQRGRCRVLHKLCGWSMERNKCAWDPLHQRVCRRILLPAGLRQPNWARMPSWKVQRTRRQRMH